MEFKNIHLVYFSPTHTSAKTVFAIAEGMQAEILLETDLTYEKSDEEIEIHKDELTVVAVPVYGGRVAETAVERIQALKGHQAPVVPVVVYGNRDYEDALRELSDLLEARGFIVVAAGAFVGEHSFSRKDMPIASRFGQDVKKKLSSLSSLTALKPVEIKGNVPYRAKGPSAPQAPVVNDELCTQCEYCIDVCPVSAISISDENMYSDPAACIKCCACVKECPEGARTFDTPYTAMLHKNFSTRREPELFF